MSKSEALLKRFKDFIRTADIVKERTYIPIGPLSLNLAIGDARGVQTGRIVQIFGKESSGKSTLSLDTIAQCQRANAFQILYVDFERSFDHEYAEACGVNLNTLLIAKPDTTETGFDIIEAAAKSGDIKLIVVDSIAATKPSSENDKDYSDNPKMASVGGLLTRFVNRIVPILDDDDVLLILLNQMRANFSTMSQEKEIPYGGLALQYNSSVKLLVQKIKTEDKRQTTQVIVRKNKVSTPQGRTEFFIDYGAGINHRADILHLAESYEIITRKGAWYSFGDLRAQGLDNACEVFPVDDIRQILLSGTQNE